MQSRGDLTPNLLSEKTFAYAIEVRNGKNADVNLTLENQIPVSQDKETTVKLLDESEGKLNEDTGRIVWKLDLKPKETKLLKLMFSVKRRDFGDEKAQGHRVKNPCL